MLSINNDHAHLYSITENAKIIAVLAYQVITEYNELAFTTPTDFQPSQLTYWKKHFRANPLAVTSKPYPLPTSPSTQSYLLKEGSKVPTCPAPPDRQPLPSLPNCQYRRVLGQIGQLISNGCGGRTTDHRLSWIDQYQEMRRTATPTDWQPLHQSPYRNIR